MYKFANRVSQKNIYGLVNTGKDKTHFCCFEALNLHCNHWANINYGVQN